MSLLNYVSDFNHQIDTQISNSKTQFQANLQFLTTTNYTPNTHTNINLHLAKDNFSKFLASSIFAAAKSVNSVALDKSIQPNWTN
ncbi:hypothetical protein Leryth_026870 [Lithospermum erythrorhizon]|nr:hypothetical protein Leryth_026870 [Lithospermum erythrorhizon]